MLLDILINDSVDFDPKTLYNSAMHNRDKLANYKTDFDKGDFYNMIFDMVSEV
jgi:predicted outer membrane protein